MRAAWAAFFERYDVLLCPVLPTAAILHDHSEPMSARSLQINGVPRPYLEQTSWAGLTGMAWLPASVAPIGLTATGLPIGVQIVGPWLEDYTPIAFAGHLAALTGGFKPPPGY
jgi:amidase